MLARLRARRTGTRVSDCARGRPCSCGASRAALIAKAAAAGAATRLAAATRRTDVRRAVSPLDRRRPRAGVAVTELASAEAVHASGTGTHASVPTCADAGGVPCHAARAPAARCAATEGEGAADAGAMGAGGMASQVAGADAGMAP